MLSVEVSRRMMFSCVTFFDLTFLIPPVSSILIPPLILRFVVSAHTPSSHLFLTCTKGLMVPDAEVLSVACEILSALPIGNFQIKLNHRRCGMPNPLLY